MPFLNKIRSVLARANHDYTSHRNPVGSGVPVAMLVILVPAGCAQQPVLEPLEEPGHATANTYAWECERNFAFVAREEGDAMWLFLPGHAVQIPRADDGPGTSYRGADIYLNHQNGKARLKTPDSRYEYCQNNIPRAAREHARLNGVDFRATGNAPGWTMEITLDGEIQLFTDSDDTTYHFITPEPVVIESERKTLYSAQNKTHQIIIELVGTACSDGYTGETHEVSVNISINDLHLKGCGGALH